MLSSKPEATGRHVVVATHGHCFDGMCSAVMFTHLLRHLHPRDTLRFTYLSAGYGPGQNGVDPKVFVGDINAILDFRFSPSPHLTWYFDHHVSAFPSPEDRLAYEAEVKAHSSSDRKMFHDGAYSSCTKLIADVGRDMFGLEVAPMTELVRWADLIDSAAFDSPQMAVERREPVLQLMTVVEQKADDAFLTQMVPKLLSTPLGEVARSDEVRQAYAPLREAHEAFVALVRERAKVRGTVVIVDLSDQLIETAGKFVTYALYPTSSYSVLLTRSKTKCKISIGYNPWSPVPRRHNIAAICERYGGGGHPVVGAISLPADAIAEAQKLTLELSEELMS